MTLTRSTLRPSSRPTVRPALLLAAATACLWLAGCASTGSGADADGGRRVSYLCGDKAPTRVDVTYQPGDPATLVARRGQRTWKMVQQRAASGARYQGADATLWEHQGEAMIALGAGSEQMRCRAAR